jgi:hypothetical protein
MSGVQSLIEFFLGNARPSSQDTVVHVKRTVLAVAWLAINQSVSLHIGTSSVSKLHLTKRSSSRKKQSFVNDHSDSGMVPILESSLL